MTAGYENCRALLEPLYGVQLWAEIMVMSSTITARGPDTTIVTVSYCTNLRTQ